MSERKALQAFQDAYNDFFGWPRAPIEPASDIQLATLEAIKAAIPHLRGDWTDAMSEPRQMSYILHQIDLENEDEERGKYKP